MLFGHFESVLEVSKLHHDFHSFFVLFILHQELDRGLESFLVIGVVPRDGLGGEIIDRDVVAHSKVHCLLFIPPTHVERDGFVEFALLLKIGCRLYHNGLAGLQAHGHDFLIIAAILSKSDGMVESLRL